MEDQPNVTRRKPSRFRPLHSFSLFTLFVVTLLVAIWAFWMQFVKPFEIDGATIYPTAVSYTHLTLPAN